MKKSEIEILEYSHHRNGVGGEGFWAILFNYHDPDDGKMLMIASLFEKSGYCAVYNVGELQNQNIKMAGGNSWRGDDFESILRPAIKKLEKQKLKEIMDKLKVTP